MASKKSATVEDRIPRIGVSWRKNPLTGNPTECVVEMRPPNWKWKLNFGSYDTELEAMIARDYGAFLRVSAGEDGTSTGGFYANGHPSIYAFEESLAIFESLEDSKVRCDEYKRLHPLYYQQPKEKRSGDTNSPHKEFCKKARKDIAIAIREFRGRYPHKFVNCRPAVEVAKDLPKVDGPPDGGIHFTPPPSNFAVKISQSSKMPENNGLSNEEIFSSGIDTFRHSSSSPDGKLCHVIRGFNAKNGGSKFDGQSPEMPPWIKED